MVWINVIVFDICIVFDDGLNEMYVCRIWFGMFRMIKVNDKIYNILVMCICGMDLVLLLFECFWFMFCFFLSCIDLMIEREIVISMNRIKIKGIMNVMVVFVLMNNISSCVYLVFVLYILMDLILILWMLIVVVIIKIE